MTDADKITAGEAYRYAHGAMEAVRRHEAQCGERWREARAAAEGIRAEIERIRLTLAADQGARKGRRQLWERQMRRLGVWGGTIATVLAALQMFALYLRSGSFG